MAKNLYSLTWCKRHFFEVICKGAPINTPQRHLSAVQKKPESVPVPVYIKRDQEFKIGKKYTIEALETLFGIRTFQASEIASRNRNLCKVNGVFLKENHTKYLENGIAKETLLKYPGILSESDVDKKIRKLKRLPFNVNEVIVLVKLSPNDLEYLLSEDDVMGLTNGRIKTISDLLQISVEECCQLLVAKKFIRQIPLEKFKKKVAVLSEFGVTGSEIANDLWVLRYKDEQIRTRLSEAKNCNIDKVKTWMVRAQPTIVENYIKRRSDTKSILGDHSLTEYLSARLGSSLDISNYLISKQPALNTKSLKKLNELIDFLFSAGFKPYHIIRVPKILVHSVDTIQKRLKQLHEKGFHVDSLYMLTKSQKQFNQHYEALVKTKGKLMNQTKS